ncbi:MAG: hypothetical protein IPK26_19680 [Planctomycetes bacterium]|nr:hypothetical protein [Planctomycetota bacterium]
MRLSLVTWLWLPCVCAQDPAPGDRPRFVHERDLFSSHGDSHSLRFSPDGSLLASGGDRGDVVVLDVATGELRGRFEASDHWIGALRFSPEGRRLAVGGRTLTLWDLAAGIELAQVPLAMPTALDWSRDGVHLAWIADNHTAVLARADALDDQRTFALADDTAADVVAFSPDNRLLAIGKRSGATTVFDVASGAVVERHQQSDWVHDLAWLADGRLLRLGFRGSLSGLDQNPRTLGKFAYQMVADPTGTEVMVRTDEDIVGLRAGQEVWRQTGGGPIALHQDQRQWAMARAGTIELRRADELLRTLAGAHREAPRGAALAGDGRLVMLRSKTLQVFDTASCLPIPVDGLPSDAELLDNHVGVEFALLLPPGGPTKLQYLAIDRVAGRPAAARLVREVALNVAWRTENDDLSPTFLTTDQRWFGHADQLLNLDEPDRSWRLDRLLVNQTVLAAGHAIAREALRSSIVGAPGRGKVMAFAPGGHRLAERRLEVAPDQLATAPDGTTVALLTGTGITLLHAPDLGEVGDIAGSWHCLLWLDERHLLGSTHDGRLQILALPNGAIVAEAELGSWARTLHWHLERRLLLAGTSDRLRLFRVELPAPTPR